jgi:hypothetical protein
MQKRFVTPFKTQLTIMWQPVQMQYSFHMLHIFFHAQVDFGQLFLLSYCPTNHG